MCIKTVKTPAIMNLNKYSTFVVISVLLVLLSIACSSTNSDDILRNQTGTLTWYGSPAADGSGMLFEVGEKQYGAPGTRENYPGLFDQDIYEVEIKADFKLTGEETVRGWGATYPAIEFIRIKRI